MNDKAFDLFAKTLAHRFALWRDHADFEALAAKPDGEIRIDVLTGEAIHMAEGSIPLVIAAELKAWLSDQLAKKRIDSSVIRSAILMVAVDTVGIKTDRKSIIHFDFEIVSTIVTNGKTYEARREERHVWHSRTPEAG